MIDSVPIEILSPHRKVHENCGIGRMPTTLLFLAFPIPVC